jgi:ketosteroid isomerase-like protein
MKSIVRRIVVAVGCIAALWRTQDALGQAEGAPKELLAAEQRFREAQLRSDADTMAATLTEDFIRSPPNLPETTKSQYVDAIRSGTQKYLSIKVREVKYRVYGDTILENVIQDVTTLRSGQQGFSRTRALYVWIKRNSGWMLAAIQGNSAPQP